MDDLRDNSHHITPRENFLMSLLHKVIKEYKSLLEYTRSIKSFKIVEILYLSSIPGETKFAIQVINKDTILTLTAAEVIQLEFNLNAFPEFHAEMLRKAAQGTLIEFLSIKNLEPDYKIISKKYDKEMQQNIFLIETKEQKTLSRTAHELSSDPDVLSKMTFTDIYDIGHTQGSESVLKEKIDLLLAKK